MLASPFVFDFHLGCIDQLISQTLCNGLDVPEGSFSGSCAQQPDGLKHKRVEVTNTHTRVGLPRALRDVSELVVGWATSDYSQ